MLLRVLEHAFQCSSFVLKIFCWFVTHEKGNFIKVLIKTEHSNTAQAMFSTGFYNVCTIYPRMILL